MVIESMLIIRTFLATYWTCDWLGDSYHFLGKTKASILYTFSTVLLSNFFVIRLAIKYGEMKTKKPLLWLISPIIKNINNGVNFKGLSTDITQLRSWFIFLIDFVNMEL